LRWLRILEFRTPVGATTFNQSLFGNFSHATKVYSKVAEISGTLVFFQPGWQPANDFAPLRFPISV
jgi:hypothetical protein